MAESDTWWHRVRATRILNDRVRKKTRLTSRHRRHVTVPGQRQIMERLQLKVGLTANN